MAHTSTSLGQETMNFNLLIDMVGILLTPWLYVGLAIKFIIHLSGGQDLLAIHKFFAIQTWRIDYVMNGGHFIVEFCSQIRDTGMMTILSRQF